MIFRSFPAADGQMSGQMSIQLTYLYRAFHALSIDMSHDQHMILIFGVVTPHWGGGHMSSPANFDSWYENLSQNQCRCRKSASYLIWCGHAPLKKTVIKKTIFRSFSAADGQMSGQMSIQLTYLYRAFHVLLIDMSHDQKCVFLIFGVVTPPGGGGVMGRSRPILVHDMKI